MGKISKTARASMDKKSKIIHPCPKCGKPLVATKVMKMNSGIVKRSGLIKLDPAGMYWVCEVCEYREKIK